MLARWGRGRRRSSRARCGPPNILFGWRGQPVPNERCRWAAAGPQGRAEPRITLTYPALESSALILFLVAGAGKRDALAQARGGIGPAGGIKPQGEVLWLVDEAAAGEED